MINASVRDLAGTCGLDRVRLKQKLPKAAPNNGDAQMNKLFLASLAVASFIACDGGKTCDSGEVCDSLGTDSGSDCTDLATAAKLPGASASRRRARIKRCSGVGG